MLFLLKQDLCSLESKMIWSKSSCSCFAYFLPLATSFALLSSAFGKASEAGTAVALQCLLLTFGTGFGYFISFASEAAEGKKALLTSCRRHCLQC